MRKGIDLNKQGTLPASDASLTGGTNGAVADTSAAALERGFSKPTPPDEPYISPFSEKEGGICGRPRGFER